MSRRGTRRRARSSGGFTVMDLCVALFMVTLVVGVTVVTTQRAREQSNRIKCASNLRQIGQSIQIYANENKGAFPSTVFDGSPNPVPTQYTAPGATNPFLPGGPGPNDVSAAMFLVLRAGDLTSEVFLCPTADTTFELARWPGDPQAASNFPSRASLSYGYTNPYPSATALALGFKLNYTLSSDFAIAADMGWGPAAGKLPANAKRAQVMTANSPNHAGDGQNVLFADVHVDWASTAYAGSPRPIPGAPRDNIYAFGVDATPAGTPAGTYGAPQDPYDSVILPTAELGVQPVAIRDRTAERLLVFGVAVLASMAVAGVVIAVKLRRRRDGNRPPRVDAAAGL